MCIGYTQESRNPSTWDNKYLRGFPEALAPRYFVGYLGGFPSLWLLASGALIGWRSSR